MTTDRVFALFVAFVCGLQLCQARTLKDSAGVTVCASACTSPLSLKSLKPGSPVSYACAASTVAGEQIGYQLSDGPATCTVSDGSEVVTTGNFTCLCKDASQTQGLDLPVKPEGCANSCLKSLDGELGMPVTSGQSYACLATTEMGTTNRFGYQTSSNTCSYVADGAVQQSSQFSCVCLFSLTLPPLAGLQQLRPQTSLATAG